MGLIEFDGMQHYKPIEFWGGDEAFRKRKQYDEIKNQFCRKNNIPLLRLPYMLSKEEIIKKINTFIHP